MLRRMTGQRYFIEFLLPADSRHRLKVSMQAVALLGE
jgi:hypothetical protein